MIQPDLGEAILEPDGPVVAGSSVMLKYTYVTGHPIDNGGFIKIASRTILDIGVPQFLDPNTPNFCTIQTTGNCRIIPRWDPKGNLRPYGQALFLKISHGYLDRGDAVFVIFGDRRGGPAGWQVPTISLDSLLFKTLVDPFATYRFKEIKNPPSLSFIPGEPTRAVCIAPSRVSIGKPFSVYLKLEDQWGNPTGKPIKTDQAEFSGPGVRRLTLAEPSTGLSTESNPIEIIDHATTLRPYWVDLHGQTGETGGVGTVEEYFRFARDYAMLDASSHQGNDFELTDENWKRVDKAASQFHRPNSFVTFPGYEWSGNTPLGGDRNVFYTGEGGPILRSSNELLPGEKSEHPVAPTAEALFKELKKLPKLQPFGFAHVGGRYPNMDMHDPELEFAVEVHSDHGTFEWLVDEALSRGYIVGICANSDDHKCHPGSSYPDRKASHSLGGLTCVFSEKLDREHIRQALKERHFYATTGNRPNIRVEAVMQDGQIASMGDVINGGKKLARLDVSVSGTAPIEFIELRNGISVVRKWRPYGPKDLGRRVKVIWRGEEAKGRERKAIWNGWLAIEGNVIGELQTINFWNPEKPLKKVGDNQLVWESCTAGGIAGLILLLDGTDAGILRLRMPPCSLDVPLDGIGFEPKVWDYGGVGKAVEVSRLPEEPNPRDVNFSFDTFNLSPGTNPLYIHVMQEDGHRAWTSPIFVVQQ